jgi:hypothetical protein
VAPVVDSGLIAWGRAITRRGAEQLVREGTMRQLCELAGGPEFDPDATPGELDEVPECWSEIF